MNGRFASVSLIVAGLGLIFHTAASADAPLLLVENGTTQYVITLPSSPAPPQQTAARELQDYLRQVTGATLPIQSENDVDADAPQIVVGASERLGALLPDLDLQALDHDGVVIKTIGNKLVLAGRPPRGTLYAVYTFLEETVGCRWWTSTESYIPQHTTLSVPSLDFRHAPPLRYREEFYRDTFGAPFAVQLKLNGHHHNIPAAMGDHYRFVGFVHTFFPFLPPEKYFVDHPEWYSELDGKRTAEHSQLCLTNPEMRLEMVKVVLEKLRADPEAGFISISQNDWHGQCQCAACREVEAEEGSPAGPLLRFVNSVAEEVEKEFPDVLVETLAYQYTRKPPRHVTPRKNVVVRLCSIECSFVEPLAAGEQNEAFRQDIEGWSEIASQLFIWDYVTNFTNYIVPHPNLRVLAPNIRFFTKNHVIGLFEQGDAQSSIGDFIRLRAWLLAHLQWDPTRNEQELVTEFLQGYYGPAAPHLQQYLDIIQDAGEQSGVYLSCFMTDTSPYLTLDDLNRATRAFDAAQQAVKDDPVLAKRVLRERLPLDHVWLLRYHPLRRVAKTTQQEFLGPDDPLAACERFIQLAHDFQVGNYRENQSFKQYEATLRDGFRPPGPPPAECRDLPDDQWIDFQDNQFRLGSPGKWAEVVDDVNASDKRAVRMPGDHFEWATSCPLSREFASPARWHCLVVARAEGQATTGPAMTMGIYDPNQKVGVVQKTVPVEQANGDDYQVYDLGTHELRNGMYIWIAPPKRPGEVDAVFVDRIYLIREP